MKHSFMKKLRSKAGETIAETLIALLISALALMMLAGAIAAANRIITRSDEVMHNYYEANDVMIQKPSTSVSNSHVSVSPAVVMYGGSSASVSFSTSCSVYTQNVLGSSRSVGLY